MGEWEAPTLQSFLDNFEIYPMYYYKGVFNILLWQS